MHFFPDLSLQNLTKLCLLLCTSMTYLVRAGASSSSGFLAAGWVGSFSGGLGGIFGGSQGGSLACAWLWIYRKLGQCVVWWVWDPVGFPQEEPLLLLRPVLLGHLTAYPWTYLHLVYLPNGRSSSVSTSGVSMYCSSGPALPLPVPVNVAAIMPPGRCDALPRGVCLVLPILFK